MLQHRQMPQAQNLADQTRGGGRFELQQGIDTAGGIAQARRRSDDLLGFRGMTQKLYLHMATMASVNVQRVSRMTECINEKQPQKHSALLRLGQPGLT